MKRRRARVIALGLPEHGRGLVLGWLLEALLEGPAPAARLLPLEEELKLRGLFREDPSAPPGGRTTRQVLDHLLRGQGPPAPEGEALLVESSDGSALVEWHDTPAALFENDSGLTDPLHPFRSHAREVAGLVLVLDAERWSAPDGVSRTELDRTAAVLRAFVALRPLSAGPLMVAVVAHGAERLPAERRAEPGRWPAVRALLHLVPTRRLRVSVWAPAAGQPEQWRAAGQWLFGRVTAPPPRRWARRLVQALALLLLAAALLVGWAAWELFQVRAAPAQLGAAEQGRLVARALARIERWERLPGLPLLGALLGLEGARAALWAHAQQLDAALRSHPAVAEPHAAVELRPAQYRTAAEWLLLAERVLAGPDTPARQREPAAVSAARRALIARLHEKARIAEMPPAAPATLAAWKELLQSCADPVLREQVVRPRVEGVVAGLLAAAERAATSAPPGAEAPPGYPELFTPVLDLEREHGGLAPEAFTEAKARLWERAWELVAAELQAAEPAARPAVLLQALARAPEPPPERFRARAGRALAPALLGAALAGGELGALAPELAAQLDGSAATALLAALPALYEETVRQPAASGPAHLAALRELVAALPRQPLAPEHAARLEALAAHLGDLERVGYYAVYVERAWASAELDSLFDTFDLVLRLESARAGPRSTPVRRNTHEASFEQPLFGPGEFAWRSWDRIEVRVHDDNREAGVRYVDEGSCFGLEQLRRGWQEPRGRGGFTLRLEPAPPARFRFEGWPQG
ncbi:MAG: hypothetical protein KatS3mg102_0386 [Planctomycetota bacterium]|nr:MAG: hypothetical protein KatS3mg102_0386 [Planctomycetota bacterium]